MGGCPDCLPPDLSSDDPGALVSKESQAACLICEVGWQRTRENVVERAGREQRLAAAMAAGWMERLLVVVVAEPITTSPHVGAVGVDLLPNLVELLGGRRI